MMPKRDPARRKNIRIKAFWENWLGNLESNPTFINALIRNNLLQINS